MCIFDTFLKQTFTLKRNLFKDGGEKGNQDRCAYIGR